MKIKSLNRIFNQGGFTLLEAVIGSFILAVGLLAVAAMQTTAVRNNSNARAVTEGATVAADGMEYLISLPGWSPTFTHDDLTAGGHQETTADGYTVNWNVSDNGPVTPDPDDPTQNTVSYKTIVVTVTAGRLGVFGTRDTVTLNFIKARDI